MLKTPIDEALPPISFIIRFYDDLIMEGKFNVR